jgi:hypothetical protein
MQIKRRSAKGVKSQNVTESAGTQTGALRDQAEEPGQSAA